MILRLAILALGLWSPLFAQSALTGRVVKDVNVKSDAEIEGIPGATIYLKEGVTVLGTKISGIDGSFKFESVPLKGDLWLDYVCDGYSPHPGHFQLKPDRPQVTILKLNGFDLADISDATRLLLKRFKESPKPDQVWMAGVYRDLPAASKVTLAQQAAKNPSFDSSDWALVSASANANTENLNRFTLQLNEAVEGRASFPLPGVGISGQLYTYEYAVTISHLPATERTQILEKYRAATGNDPAAIKKWLDVTPAVELVVQKTPYMLLPK
jgi:hypothetical protein